MKQFLIIHIIYPMLNKHINLLLLKNKHTNYFYHIHDTSKKHSDSIFQQAQPLFKGTLDWKRQLGLFTRLIHNHFPQCYWFEYLIVIYPKTVSQIYLFGRVAELIRFAIFCHVGFSFQRFSTSIPHPFMCQFFCGLSVIIALVESSSSFTCFHKKSKQSLLIPFYQSTIDHILAGHIDYMQDRTVHSTP